jgi:predicted membrane protein
MMNMLTEESPTTKQLREFGLVSSLIVVVLFGLLLPWILDHAIPLWPWVLAALLVVWTLVHAASLVYIYRPWLKFGAILGYINTRILLGMVFFLIVTPIGWIIRLFGKRLLEKTVDESKSYRVLSERPDNKHMENPY